MDPRIFAGKAAGERASFLVVMREQADLSGAEAFAGKAEKGRFVYEALRAQAEASQAPVRARLEAAGVAFRSFYLVNMIEVEGDRALAGELAAREDVSSVAPNNEAAREPEPVIERQPLASRLGPAAATVEENIARVGAPGVWARGFTGQGIVVGMADTGVAWEHPALKSHYRGFNGTTASHDYNWHDAIHNALPANPCGSDTSAPCDDDSHGTATASLAVGDDGVGNQIGMAPGARFIACRNMDQGNGTPARYTECFQFFLAPTDHTGGNARPDLAAHVINNSWGCPVTEGCTDPNVLKAIVENVSAAGIVVVVSAGNSGPACSTISDPPGLLRRVPLGGGDRVERRHDRELLQPRSDHGGRFKPPEARHFRSRRECPRRGAPRELSHGIQRDLRLGAARDRRRRPPLVGRAAAHRKCRGDDRPVEAHRPALDLDAGLRRLLRRDRPQSCLRIRTPGREPGRRRRGPSGPSHGRPLAAAPRHAAGPSEAMTRALSF